MVIVNDMSTSLVNIMKIEGRGSILIYIDCSFTASVFFFWVAVGSNFETSLCVNITVSHLTIAVQHDHFFFPLNPFFRLFYTLDVMKLDMPLTSICQELRGVEGN